MKESQPSFYVGEAGFIYMKYMLEHRLVVIIHSLHFVSDDVVPRLHVHDTEPAPLGVPVQLPEDGARAPERHHLDWYQLCPGLCVRHQGHAGRLEDAGGADLGTDQEAGGGQGPGRRVPDEQGGHPARAGHARGQTESKLFRSRDNMVFLFYIQKLQTW